MELEKKEKFRKFKGLMNMISKVTECIQIIKMP